MLGLQLHGNGQQRIDGGLEIAAGTEGTVTAGHHEATALLADVEVERLQEIIRHLVGRDVVENHRAGSDQLAGLEQRRIIDGLNGEILRFEDLRDRIVLVTGGQQHAWTTVDFDPAVRAVVAGMGVLFRQDLRLILEGSGARNAVGEFRLADAVDQRD